MRQCCRRCRTQNVALDHENDEAAAATAAAVEAAKPKAIKVELTDEQKQQKKEDDARSVLGFMKSPKNPVASLGSSPKRADSGSLELHIERATGLPAYTVCYCKGAFIPCTHSVFFCGWNECCAWW